MQRLENLLQESETITLEDPPEDTILQSPLSIWGQRKKEVQQCWQEARPQNLANLLSAERIPTMTCSHCHVREAIIRCRECLPSEWFCECCDTLIHKHHILHSRQTTISGFFKYIPPTEFVKLHDSNYIICEQGLWWFASPPTDIILNYALYFYCIVQLLHVNHYNLIVLCFHRLFATNSLASDNLFL